MEELAAHGAAHGASLTADAPPFLCFEGIRYWRYIDAFHDTTPRLAEMDRAGVDCQVLSLGPPMLYWAPPALGLRLARIWNDEIAKVVRAHPDRFVALAALPLQDVDASLIELDRAVGDLGLSGVAVGSNVHGTPLDDRSLWPFYERVEQLDVPIFIHPINPLGQPKMHDYRLDLVVGFPFDTTLAAVRLVCCGVLERFPRLRVCLAHLGGALPFLRERIVIGHRVSTVFGAAMAITESPEKYLERFWLDSVSYYDPAMMAGIACVGAPHIVLGSDAPFAVGDLGRSVASIRGLTFLSEGEREAILGPNALEWLGRGLER